MCIIEVSKGFPKRVEVWEELMNRLEKEWNKKGEMRAVLLRLGAV